MARPSSVAKPGPCKFTRGSVPGDNVNMHMSVLVLQERIVEVIRPKGPLQSFSNHAQEAVQLNPLIRTEIGKGLRVTLQCQEALAKQVLVPVQNHLPMAAFTDCRPEIRGTQSTRSQWRLAGKGSEKRVRSLLFAFQCPVSTSRNGAHRNWR